MNYNLLMITPTQDNKIYQKYSKKTLQNKEKNKIAFCQDFDLKYDKKTALLGLSYALTEDHQLDILKAAMEGILEQDVNLAVMGIGSEAYQKFFTKLSQDHPGRIAILNNHETNERKLYAAGDIYLCTSSESDCTKPMLEALNYGMVPICPESIDEIRNYNGAKEEGNGFTFKEGSVWSFFAALVRTLENFKFTYDWKTIQASAMGEESEDYFEEQ